MPTHALHNVLEHLEDGPLTASEHPTEEDLIPLRERIDALDEALLKLMNERVSCAHAIGHIKKKLDMPVYVPSREEKVLQNVMEANEGPLPDTVVRRLFERIIDETRSLERQQFQEGQDK